MKIPKKIKLNSFGIFSNMTDLQKTIVYRFAFLLFIIVLMVIIIFAQTIAWQTNVVHTGGLMLSADTWNFSAEVKIDDKSISAAPGDTGTIDIQITNDSSSLAVASVRAIRDQLVETMKNRMFFYVDVATVQNGENVDVIYVNTKNSYTYTVFPYQELLLKAGISQQPLVKWVWTYDNLGYYVYGKKTETGNIEIIDYLRPIEYDFDYMRTTFDEDGRLETIDGVLTKEEFLVSLSKNDGYKGEIDTSAEAVTPDGYYPVEVNEETGYGVFAYLCTIDEINQGSRNDAELGINNAEIGKATIQFTGQNSNSDGVAVFNEQTLKEALNTPGLNILTLNQDVALSESISISGSAQVVINLDGNKISSSASTVFDVKDGASLILSNGEITGNGGTGVSSVASYVTMNDVTITNVEEGFVIHDQLSSVATDSVVHLTNCNINAKEDGILIYGNNSTQSKTKLVVDECDIYGEQYAGIICNGSQYGTEILVKNSSLKGKYTAIYFPQKDSTLDVVSSYLEGYTGIAVKGGTVNIVDSTIKGTGEYSPLPQPSELSMSGWWDTGDGVYLEANYTQNQTKIFISGEQTKITSTHEGTQAVRMYPELATIEISGGTFSSDVTPFVKEGCQIELTQDGYKVTNN